MWNLRDTVLQGLSETNNSVEGGLKKLVASRHCNIWKFIKKEQIINELRIEQYLCGQPHKIQLGKNIAIVMNELIVAILLIF